MGSHTSDTALASRERSILGFQLGNEHFGIDMRDVREVRRIGPMTRLPGAPRFVRGLMHAGGHVIPVIDLRRRFGMAELEAVEESRILVVDAGEKPIGLAADRITQVLHVTDADIDLSAPSSVGMHQDYVAGLIEHEENIVILLDLLRLFGTASGEASA